MRSFNQPFLITKHRRKRFPWDKGSLRHRWVGPQTHPQNVKRSNRVGVRVEQLKVSFSTVFARLRRKFQ